MTLKVKGCTFFSHAYVMFKHTPSHTRVSPFSLMCFVIGPPAFLSMYAHFLQFRKIYKENRGKTHTDTHTHHPLCSCTCVCFSYTRTVRYLQPMMTTLWSIDTVVSQSSSQNHEVSNVLLNVLLQQHKKEIS